MVSVTGKTAVITGAAGHLGPVVARKFLEAGARAALAYHSESGLQRLLPELPPDGEHIEVRMNVTDEDSVAHLMSEAHERLGGPHILIHLVGDYTFGQRIAEMELQTWTRVLNSNLTSAMLCAREALKLMLPQDYGRIVLVTSKVAQDLRPGVAAYGVAKAGLITLTTALAHELKGTGVSAAAVMPSVIDTEETRAQMPDADFSKWVKPEAIADVMLFLAGEQGGAANGAVVPLFGGL